MPTQSIAPARDVPEVFAAVTRPQRPHFMRMTPVARRIQQIASAAIAPMDFAPVLIQFLLIMPLLLATRETTRIAVVQTAAGMTDFAINQ